MIQRYPPIAAEGRYGIIPSESQKAGSHIIIKPKNLINLNKQATSDMSVEIIFLLPPDLGKRVNRGAKRRASRLLLIGKCIFSNSVCHENFLND